MKKLDGKVAVITGGASGIGEATARLFAAHGARAVVIADVQDENGLKVVESIGSHVCNYFHCDVTDETQVKSLVDWTVQTHGQIDVMFSNAGVVSRSDQTVIDLDFAEFDRVFAVNVRGTAACVKEAARAMVEGRVRGSIVCTSSTAGRSGVKQKTDYSMSKHAVVSLVRSASQQLGEHGIRVNSVAPFAVATPLLCNMVGGMGVEETEKIFEPLVPLKGATMKVQDVADAVLFLASGDSAFITGHDLLVDSGFCS